RHRLDRLHDLVVLDQGVGEQPLTHLRELRGVLDVEFDQPADVDVVDAREPERGQGPLNCLALWIEHPFLWPDQDPGSHETPVRRNQFANGSPVTRSYASTYLARVRSTTSSGIAGAGGVRSQPVDDAQSRTYCLSKLGCPLPGSYSSAGQKREESGVQTSSPSVSVPSSSRPSSNFVSARMMPLARACSAACLYSAIDTSRTRSVSSRSPTSLTAPSKSIASSWPTSALVDGVNSGSGSWSDS